METSTIALILIASIGFGLSAFLDKIAVNEIGPKSVVLIYVTMTLISLIYFFLLENATPGWSSKGVIISILSGVFWGVGGIGLYIAIQRVNISIISPMVALYPIIAVVLGIALLHEKLTLANAAGVVFAIIAGVLLAL